MSDQPLTDVEYRRCQDAASRDRPGSAVHLFAEFERIKAGAYAAGVAAGERRVRERVEALRPLSDAATPGPWWVHDANDCDVWAGDQAAVRAVDQDARAARPLMTDEEIEAVWDLADSIGAGDLKWPEDATLIAAAVNYVRAALADSSPDPEGLPKDAPWPRDECGNRGPRIGEDGTLCRRSKGHVGQHRTAPSDGFGDVRWKNWDAPEPEATGDCVRHTALSTGRDVCLTHEREWPGEATGDVKRAEIGNYIGTCVTCRQACGCDRLAARRPAPDADTTISRAEAIDLHWLIAVAIRTGLPRGSMLNLAHRLSDRIAEHTGDTSTTDMWLARVGDAAPDADTGVTAAVWTHEQIVSAFEAVKRERKETSGRPIDWWSFETGFRAAVESAAPAEAEGGGES